MKPRLKPQLELRPTQLADLPFILATEGHAENAPYITQCSGAWHEAAIASEDCAHLVVLRSSDEYTVSMQAQQNQPLLGYIILAGIQSPHLALELRRIAIVEKGRGYGRQLLRWTKDLAFNQLKHHRLWLDVLERNDRARRLYESEGFVAEGIIRESFKTATGYESRVLMSILESEFLAGRSLESESLKSASLASKVLCRSEFMPNKLAP